MKRKSAFSIGAAAKKTGTSIHTLRYYEKIGLIHKAARSQGGFRIYSQRSIDRILFIKKAQHFGLTLEDIKKIMRCGDKGLGPCCTMVEKIFKNKLVEFEKKMIGLQKTRRRLKALLSSWTK